MSPEGFLRRLRSGKAVNCIYRIGDLEGLISACRCESGYVLTWEEGRIGDQYNEPAYTRDERRQFETAEQLLAYAEQAGFAPSAFAP